MYTTLLQQHQYDFATNGMVENKVDGLVVLSPVGKRCVRRILHVNGYGGRYVWERIKQGVLPGHQLLGCIELVRMGYRCTGRTSARLLFPSEPNSARPQAAQDG